jgi:hypothetical protein
MGEYRKCHFTITKIRQVYEIKKGRIMKIRNGWVSNSSSSSFTLFTASEDIKMCLSLDLLETIPKKYPLRKAIESIVDTIDDCIYDDMKGLSKKAWLAQNNYETEEEAKENTYDWDSYKKYFDMGWFVSFGGFSNEEYGMELGLHEISDENTLSWRHKNSAFISAD